MKTLIFPLAAMLVFSLGTNAVQYTNSKKATVALDEAVIGIRSTYINAAENMAGIVENDMGPMAPVDHLKRMHVNHMLLLLNTGKLTSAEIERLDILHEKLLNDHFATGFRQGEEQGEGTCKCLEK